METLPALKITHFNGEPARGQVYAYLRCYVRDGEIPFSVTVFDETPPDTARFGFAVTPDDAAGTYLFASCTKQQGDALWLYRTGEPADVPLRRLEMPPMRHLAGSDEQGFYWSAEGVLPAQAFRTAFGRVPRVGGILPGNAFLYDVSEPAFGAAFPVPAGAGVPTAAGFGTFVVVPYCPARVLSQCSLFSPPHPLIPHLPANAGILIAGGVLLCSNLS